jgi:threonine aldolase
MFGGSLPHAWPYAAVALYFLDGFAGRFAEAVAAAERFYAALGEHPRMTIDRPAAATNVTVLRIRGARAANLPTHLLARGIAIRPPRRQSPTGAEFTLHTNETILHRPLAEILDSFVAALAETF